MSDYVPHLVAGAAIAAAAAYAYLGAGGQSKGTEVCLASDLQPGEMRDVTVDGTKVLLVKTESGAIHATSPKCTHYAAPLSKGTLQGERVLCPWHGACFNVASGDVEDAPALDPLAVHSVTVEGGRVFVRVATQANRGDPGLCSRSNKAAGEETYVILGGGAAGAVAAETLRKEGFGGRVVVVCEEAHVPYDRVKLSKSLSVTAASIALRPAEFYAKHGIELMLGEAATAVDTEAKVVRTSKGGSVRYDKLLVATGGFARRITMAPGHELGGIHTLRVPEDANAINTAAEKSKSVVIVGSSFIGMEAAACLKQAKKVDRIVVVGMEKVPFERVLGSEIGAAMMDFHASKGIEFRMECVVKEFRADASGERVGAVELNSGEVIECDLCVVGAGIICGTKYLGESGFELERDGSIVVDDRLRVAKGPQGATGGNVFVAGDIARFPYSGAGGDLIRIEHWDVAQQQGRVAARNMLGKDVPFETVPFFWTAQYGKSLRYAGNCMAPDDIIVKGSLADLTFVAYYVAKGKITAVATMGADPVAVAASELLRQGKMPTPATIKRKDEITYLASLVKPI